jgi:ubiquinone/menaquinone biosynthesis C-methylase UbiE
MNFPNIEEIISYAGSEYEKDFLRMEFEPGLEYYLSRLDQIMFSGGHILDAGCGAGQWTIALAQRFNKVSAIDLKPERLNVLKAVSEKMSCNNIQIDTGSIESLPYKENTFDAVFCYGVIMFTDIKKVLSEFHRVLRPGGRIYICFNADGWSHYLIEERSKTNTNIKVMGQDTLYSTYWRRAIDWGIIDCIKKEFNLINYAAGEIKFSFAGKLFHKYRNVLPKRFNRSLIKRVLLNHLAGEYLWRQILNNCGDFYVEKLTQDVLAIAGGADKPPQMGQTRAYSSEEFQRLIQSAGFDDFQWSTEGKIICDWTKPLVKSKYEDVNKKHFSVLECIFVKPMCISQRFSLDAFHNIFTCRQSSVYAEITENTIVSNRSVQTYPPELYNYYKQMAAKLGSTNCLKKIVQQLLCQATTDESRLKILIRYVQDALFRDPVSQPLTEDGQIPDALTILLCGKGRCGHSTKLLMELCSIAGLENKWTQFEAHIIAEVKIDGRFVIADCDAFKNGIIPVNRQGKLLSLNEINENPYQLDRFQPSGWFIRPNSRFTKGIFGTNIYGYVDALEPDKRGFVSGYYSAKAKGFPPSIPVITKFCQKGNSVMLEWEPSKICDGRIIEYRVRIGTASRDWSYDRPGNSDNILNSTSSDILEISTTQTHCETVTQKHPANIFASVTAVSDRIEKEKDTYFWPSEEISLAIQS